MLNKNTRLLKIPGEVLEVGVDSAQRRSDPPRGDADMDKQVRDLIAICVLAALCCVAAWAFNLGVFATVFGLASIVAATAAIRRLV